jgi:tRNA-splicing ligase RtcB
MNAQEFHQLISNTKLSHNERNEAWRLFKAVAPEAGFHYVQQIQAYTTHLSSIQNLQDKPAPYAIWGSEHIDQTAIDQMDAAARLPIAIAGALMPDAHKGYGLPIGGVLATDNAVIPYAVGIDIACRMKMTVYPISSDILTQLHTPEFERLQNILVTHTIFGAGGDGVHEGKIEHPILEKDNWQSTKLIRGLRMTAIHQIGTSGTGNHFVEWGEFTIQDNSNPLNLEPGNYLALLSHSGSRGVGYKIAEHFTSLAMELMPNLDERVKHLAWLPLDKEAGQEYWDAMQLAGQFASANHHVIHDRISKAAGFEPIASIENHHNFAWREKIEVDGTIKEAIIHRKGATPADKGVLGIIPGTMADKGFVVIGKGNSRSLNSASHGSGRQMSRSTALRTITPQQQQEYLTNARVTLIGGGLDEAPQAYKPIEKVIEAQSDLVDIIGTFQPRIVRMAEDKPINWSKPTPAGIVDGKED